MLCAPNRAQQDVLLSTKTRLRQTQTPQASLKFLLLIYITTRSPMVRPKTDEKDELKHKLNTRVNEETYERLLVILEGNPQLDMSVLLRNMIEDKPVKVFTRDLTLDNVMEELAKIRTELRSIGVNINQITRLFNTYPEERQKEIYARMAFGRYRAIEPKVDRLLELVENLSKKWLQ
jgi:hypothetical protein